MADLQISALPALGEAGIQATDVLALADLSATETKKVTVKDLIAAGAALIDSGDIPAAKVATPFAANAVETATIQNLAVTAAKIANSTITATQIANTTITAAKIVDNTLTATQIAANAITDSELANSAVDTDAIANLAVTNAKIANTTIAYGKLNLSDGDIPGAKIASGGITSTQLATNSVTATELADNAVDANAIASGVITGAKIASTTIAAGNIVNNTITSTQLANNAVGTNQIADGAVTTAKLSGTISAGTITDGAVSTAKLADDAVTSAKLAANAVDAAALANNSVDAGAIASNAVTEAKIAANAVVNAKITDGTITAAKLNTSNIDRSLNVASGNLGINNTVTAATRSGISYNAQGLITGTIALAAGDLPVATTSAVGGVSVGTGLSVSGAGALSLTNSVTGATVSGITFNAQGMITAATALVAGDLPVATTSAKGAVQITSGGGLTVDGSGNLSTSTSGISAGTYQSITVNNKGVATAGAALTAALIPDLAASKITTGSLDAARIANDSIDGTKLSNASTAIFQSIAQSGYPTAQFNGQILFDTVSEDAFIYDGNAWQAITTLTKGSLVFGGTFNANSSQMVATTSAGIAAGLSVGSNLPTPSATTDGVYVVVATSGTPASPAPAIAFAPPDYILGVTNSAGSSWNEVDLSQTVAGQVASNITFTPYGQISATNVQDALQELETEKMGLAGGTCTGQLLIAHTGSIVFEGATVDAYELTLAVADPQSSDKTITFPDITGTLITTGDTNTVTSTMVNGSLVNTNLAANAAIAFSKLAALNSAQIIVGNGSNVPTAVAVTGDIGINNAGLTSITAGAIVNADVSSTAAIAGSKITTGTTSAVGVLQLTDSTSSTSATTAATPNAVKSAYDLAALALPKSGGTLTGNALVDNDKEVRFYEADGNGSAYVGIKGATEKGSESSYTISLPAAAPTANQILKANASSPTTLEWTTDAATDASKLPLTGGTLTGDLTLNAQKDLRFADADSSHYIALQASGTIASSFTLTLPATDAAVSGYVLASDGSGTLSWVDPGSSSSPTFTGDATLTNDGALVGFSNLNATYTGNVKTLVVTVASKTGAHRYYGSGSGSGYKIGGKESPFITLTPGRTYKFDQADNSNSGHPLRFYLEADKTTAYTTGVTTNGTAGSAGAYTQIVVSDTTPQILHYQCSAHALMGNSVQTNSNQADLSTLNASNLSSGTVNVARLGSGSSVSTKFLRGDNTWQTISATPEGTAILSTGESGGTKFLREDGDGTCSWQTVTGTTINNNADNRLITGSGTANTLEGEANLTYDGSSLSIKGTSSTKMILEGATTPSIYFYENSTSKGYVGWQPNGYLQLVNQEDNSALRIKDDLQFSTDNSTFYSVLTSNSNLNASKLSSGTVATARLGSGTAQFSTVLRGDGTWGAPANLQTATTSSNQTYYIPLVGGWGAGGSSFYGDSSNSLTYNPSTNVLTSGSFSGSGAGLTSIPAANLTGTVADARISTLTASKLTGALPAIDGSNLTNLPASGGTITATASGSIAAKDALIINSSGQATKIVKSISQQTPATTGTPDVVYTGTGQNGHTIIYAPSIDRFFCGYERSNYIYGRMGQVVSGNAITWGTEIACSGTQGSNPQVCFDISAGLPVYVWEGPSNTSAYVRPMGINTSNNSMSHGTQFQYGTNRAMNPNIVYDVSAQRCVIVYKQTNDNYVVTKYIDVTSASSATVSPSSTGYGTYVSSNNGGSAALGICYDPDQNGVIAFWKETGGTHNGKTGVCKITTPSSGTSASTISSTYYWIPANSYVPNGFSCDYDQKENRVVTAYTNGATSYANIQISVGQWNGSLYGMGTNHGNSVGSTNGLISSTYDSTAERVVVAWGESSPSSNIKSFSIGGTGYTVTESSIGTLDANARQVNWLNGRTGFADYPSDGGMMLLFRDDGNQDRFSTLFVTSALPSTNLNVGNFVGFAASSVSSGQTATINIVSGTTSWTASTLTPGTGYYVQDDGTLGTSAATLAGSVSAGLALTSSSLLIK